DDAFGVRGNAGEIRAVEDRVLEGARSNQGLGIRDVGDELDVDPVAAGCNHVVPSTLSLEPVTPRFRQEIDPGTSGSKATSARLLADEIEGVTGLNTCKNTPSFTVSLFGDFQDAFRSSDPRPHRSD